MVKPEERKKERRKKGGRKRSTTKNSSDFFFPSSSASKEAQNHQVYLIIMGGKTENTTIKTLMEITGQTKEDVSSVLQKFGGDEDLAVSELMSSACFFFCFFFSRVKIEFVFFWTTEIETNAALRCGFRDATDRWLLRDCSAQVCGRQNEKE